MLGQYNIVFMGNITCLANMPIHPWMDGHIGQACNIAHEYDIILAKHVILYWMDGWMDGHIGQACYVILPMNTILYWPSM